MYELYTCIHLLQFNGNILLRQGPKVFFGDFYESLVQARREEERGKFSRDPRRLGAPTSLMKYFCYMFDSKTDHLNWAYVSRENGFPGPAVGVGGPALANITKLCKLYNYT